MKREFKRSKHCKFGQTQRWKNAVLGKCNQRTEKMEGCKNKDSKVKQKTQNIPTNCGPLVFMIKVTFAIFVIISMFEIFSMFEIIVIIGSAAPRP